MRAQVAGRLGQGHALLAGRTITQVAHGVEGLAGTAGGNHHGASGQRTGRDGHLPGRALDGLGAAMTVDAHRPQGRQACGGRALLLRIGVQGLGRGVAGRVHRVRGTLRVPRDDLLRQAEDVLGFGHAAGAGVRARQTANRRLNHVVAPRTQGLHVRAGRRVLPHLRVHGRGQNHGRVRGQHGRRQQIIRAAGSQAGQQVSGGRGNHHGVGLLGLAHVVHLGHALEHVGRNGVAAQRLQGGHPHELGRVRGGHGDNLVTILRKKAKEHRRLVRGDAPSHTNDNAHGTSDNP